jgi:hypothetical protein
VCIDVIWAVLRVILDHEDKRVICIAAFEIFSISNPTHNRCRRRLPGVHAITGGWKIPV